MNTNRTIGRGSAWSRWAATLRARFGRVWLRRGRALQLRRAAAVMRGETTRSRGLERPPVVTLAPVLRFATTVVPGRVATTPRQRAVPPSSHLLAPAKSAAPASRGGGGVRRQEIRRATRETATQVGRERRRRASSPPGGSGPRPALQIAAVHRAAPPETRRFVERGGHAPVRATSAFAGAAPRVPSAITWAARPEHDHAVIRRRARLELRAAAAAPLQHRTSPTRATAASSAPSDQGRGRSPSSPPSPAGAQPTLPLAAPDLDRLTAAVMRQLDHRLLAHRERMGRGAF